MSVFMSPDENTPKSLIDALYLIDEMSTKEDMDALLDATIQAGISLDRMPDQSPTDVAVQVWLRNPTILERLHAEHQLSRPRSFEYYMTNQAVPTPFSPPNNATVLTLEDALDNWFEGHNRGRSARVFTYTRPDGVWFSVRHGEPFKREESVENGEPSSIAYRPLRYDILIFQPTSGELAIHAPSKGERQLYRTAFGRHLFGSADYFPDDGKYTLKPLRVDGERSLCCGDVEGIKWVKLREVELRWGGPQGLSETLSAKNLFAALASCGRSLPAAAKLHKAVFLVQFSDAPKPRSVTIKPPNVALYTRDGDGAHVGEWLKRRGFLVGDGGDPDADDPLLVGA